MKPGRTITRAKTACRSRAHPHRLSGPVQLIAVLACLSVSTAAYSQVKIPDTSTLPKQTRSVLASLNLGLTRADVERECRIDGGMAVPFHSERYILPGYFDRINFIMIDIRFRPAGVPDAVYKDPQRFQEWLFAHRKGIWISPTDIVDSISPPYLHRMDFD